MGQPSALQCNVTTEHDCVSYVEIISHLQWKAPGLACAMGPLVRMCAPPAHQSFRLRHLSCKTATERNQQSFGWHVSLDCTDTLCLRDYLYGNGKTSVATDYDMRTSDGPETKVGHGQCEKQTVNFLSRLSCTCQCGGWSCVAARIANR